MASVDEDTDEIFGSLCAGTSGCAPLRGFDRRNFRAAMPMRSTIALHPAPIYLARDRLAFASGRRGIADAGLDEDFPERR